MNLIVHAELSWLVAQALPDRRDRLIVTAAGVLPDLDALSLLGGVEAYGRYHHLLTHGFCAALVVAALCASLSKRRLRAALFGALAFHLHLMCDLAGSGPDWPLFYLWPASGEAWYWAGQWNLASWQNGVIGVAASVACLATAFPLRRTIVEIASTRGDAAVVRALWQRFRPGAGDPFARPS